MARSTIWAATAVALGISLGICCQPLSGADLQGTVPAGTAPTIITWEVEASGGVRARLRAKPGEAVQLTRPDGTEIAMVPHLSDAESGAVTFEVFEVSGSPEKQTLRKVDEIETHPGTIALSRTVADLSLKLVGSRPPEPAPPRATGEEENPASGRIVRWTLTLADGRLVKIGTIDGTVTRVQLPDGRLLGFKPTVQSEDGVRFDVFSIEREAGKYMVSGEKLSPLERFDISAGGEYFPRALENSLIKVGTVERISPEAWRRALSRVPSGRTKSRCCVTCGVRVCGCSVSMDCGECCVPPCCPWEI